MRRSFLFFAACIALASSARSQTVLFSDSFENGFSNWSAFGLWHLVDSSDTCGAQVTPFPQGTQCMYYGIAGACNYDTGFSSNAGDLTLLTPIAIPATGPVASLHCWTRHETEPCGRTGGYDLFNVEISSNGGGS